MSQDAVFVASEADRWFDRNREALLKLDLQQDLSLRLLQLYGVTPATALEVGGANGYRLAELANRCGARCTVVEPSAAAVADGRTRFPKLTFHVGEAKALPVEGPFDLVVVNYVLHWIDRASLLRVVAELDRVLADGGHLLIGDFAPWLPTQVRYHHLPDQAVYTYKQDYAELFLASRLYQPVAMLSGDGNALDATTADGKRASVTLLRKRLAGAHELREFKPA